MNEVTNCGIVQDEYEMKDNKYYCAACEYFCSLKHHMKKHLLTKKHTKKVEIENKKATTTFVCVCDKEFSSKEALYRHRRRTCNVAIENKAGRPANSQSPQPVEQIINNDYSTVTNNNNTNVQVNNHFNLQLYLNDRCKDAINLSDFTQKIEMSLDDLSLMSTHGWAEGMAQIIIQRLEDMEADKRPIQTSDVRRNVTYIKEGDWVKDESTNFITEAIDKINKEQYKTLGEWSKENPPVGGSKSADKFHEIVSSLNPGDDKDKQIKKVKKRIASATSIDKINE